MRVLVTGTSGHIGGAVARYLAGADCFVSGISRRREDSLPEAVEQHSFDIGDDEFVQHATSAIAPCDAIVHAAALLDPDPYAPGISRTNCWGTQQILRLAEEWQVKGFVFMSGVAVIGSPLQHPITEEHPAHPSSAYTASKLFGEHLVAAFARAHSCGASLRVSSPVGPGLTAERIFSIFVERALAGETISVRGEGRRQDYVDVRDVARAAELGIQQETAGVFNIGSGKAVSNLELAEAVVHTLKSPSEIRCEADPDAQEDPCWDVSLEKARRTLGYEPRYSLEDSIQALAEERSARR